MFYNSDAENSEASSQKPIEEKAVTPSPEQVFAECSQKRILGLLAAMLPPLKSVRDKCHFLFKGGVVLHIENNFLVSHILKPVVNSSHLCIPDGRVIN